MTGPSIQGKPATILLVEDNEGDIFLTQKAFQKAKIKNEIYIATDGEMALAMLQKIPKPDIILLDINLPKLNGKQVLQEIRNNPQTQSLIVIVMTGSPAELEIVKAEDIQADAYIIKPVTIEKFGEAMEHAANTWFGILALFSSKKEPV